MVALTSTDWILVAATVAGPILAVQAQKVVERLTETRRRKHYIFRTLMATRAARLSVEHVQALNMIDLEFTGSKILGVFRYQSALDKAVVNTWREYLDSLQPLTVNATEDDKKRWNERTIDKFIDLLSALTSALGFEFNKAQLKNGIYSPEAHSEAEQAQIQIRDSLAKILSGQRSFPMAVTYFPYSEEANKLQSEVQTALLASLKGDKTLRVTLENSSQTEGTK